MAEGISTLPPGRPALTLGWGVVRHASRYLRQPDGPSAGQAWKPTPGQLNFMLWWYAVDEDGRWLFQHGARRLAKGSGKSPFAAVMALEELVGPVRLKDFDPKAMGGVIGKPEGLPLVQIAATASSQTANTMRMVRAMTTKRSPLVKAYSLDAAKTIIYVPEGGQLEIITSSAATAEGALATFVIEDETEHWTPSMSGEDLHNTLVDNLAKSSNRSIETANAWVPGSMSVAETTWDSWVAQQAGQTKSKVGTLYDARIAPADTDLGDYDSLRAGLEFVYEDCAWADVQTYIDRIWDPSTPPNESRRKYLNQPTAGEDAWTTPQAWGALADPSRVVAAGEEITMFFDGSKSGDNTALMGCCMSDGHVFKLGIWVAPDGGEIDAVAVDATVSQTFLKYRVVGFYADVREWEGFVKVTWPTAYADQLLVSAQKAGIDPSPIAWDMRKRVLEFAQAAELTLTEINEGGFTHDGDLLVAQHVANARAYPVKASTYTSITKESRMSAKKIDAAVCVIGARMVRRHVLASDEWAKYQRRKNRKPARAIIYS